ncbi:hypothetical protein [uncultured Gilvimarinus sp.]|uniref:hypothetical protein n=1 Tax=uncultured Gilvimarinus sp. TaxID=1689143 RepID=UPI0030EEF035|tara:strand:+ start:59 stop:922 length:864 start_codon:yes stop_codon:yes gene_type:complete
MITSFFGQYLLLKGIVTGSRLREAMALQSEVNQTLAQRALMAGVLSQQQLEKLPLSGCENDALFSQIVVNLGWINRAALEALHAEQRTLQLTLGEALVKCGYLSDNNLPNLLTDYHYWNLRNLQLFGAQVSRSQFASEVDTFSFALTQHMLKVYGLHVKPDCADHSPVTDAPVWAWQIQTQHHRLNIMVPDVGEGIARLLNRAELIGALNLPSLADPELEGAGDIPSPMTPTQFFASLLHLLLADSGGQAIRQIDGEEAVAYSAGQECLRCCYSIEGELFDIFACPA